MASLIYKQRHFSPNKKGASIAVRNFVIYIGERVHALKDEETKNGLFGKINGAYFDKIQMTEMLKHVDFLTKNRVTVFQGMVSFTPDAPEELGLCDAQAWQDYVKSTAHIYAEKNGIDLAKYEWAAGVHLKENQPHFHFLFWDKTVGAVQRQFVNWKVADEIRRALIKTTFAEQLYELGLEKTRALAAVSEISDDSLARLSEKLLLDFQKLLDGLPQTGSLKYEFLPPDYKELLNKFCRDLRAEHTPLAEEYDKFIEAKRALAKAYNSTETAWGKYQIEKVVGAAADEVDRKIANRVLKTLKSCKIKIAENERYEKSVERRKAFINSQKNQAVFGMINSIISMLKRSNNGGEDSSEKKTSANGEKSEAAKLDAIYKSEDKGQER